MDKKNKWNLYYTSIPLWNDDEIQSENLNDLINKQGYLTIDTTMNDNK